MSKQLKIIIVAAVAVVGLGTALFIAQPKEGQQTATNGHQGMDMGSDKTVTGVLEASTTFHDFGTISMKNGKVSTVFKVKNVKSEPVALTRLYTSCMCTEATINVAGKTEGPFGMLGHGFIPKFERALQPNQDADVEVVFDPNAHGPAGVGTIERTVTVEGQDGKLAELNIKATVTP
jgi:hypothetical protein